LGLMRRETDGGPAIGHEGAGAGFQSMMYWFPDLGIIMVAVTNSSGQKATLELVLQGVIDLVRNGDNAALFGG
jgi:CubicO group peptidase (beta-lactamase class C family)